MERKIIYQTLEDRGDPFYVEENGPFDCNWSNTWLGNGYYFWDTFVQNAHWWAEVREYDEYIICEGVINFCNSRCFDLVGDTNHMLHFSQSVELMKSKGLFGKRTTVARVLNYMRHTIKVFDYEAIRAYGVLSKSTKVARKYGLQFELNRSQYLDYKPAIQICLFDKSNLDFKDFRIIYPDTYISDYVV